MHSKYTINTIYLYIYETHALSSLKTVFFDRFILIEFSL
jgi:hypothetical protein